MRIAFGELKQESNTFSPVLTTLDDFYAYHLYCGKEIEERLKGTKTEIAGFLDTATTKGIELIPTVAAMAMSGGKVTAETYDFLKERLLEGIAKAGPIDGVVLALHGAMVIVGSDDAEGDLLTAVRDTVGHATPIIASLDLHANVTEKMVKAADILLGFDTCPHVDLYETGCRAMELASRLVKWEIDPVMTLKKVPMIVPPDTMDTSSGPLGDLIGEAKALEQRPEILSASIFAVQPWLDVPDLGFGVVVVADADLTAAQDGADRLASRVWAVRRQFYVDLVPVSEAVQRALTIKRRPVVLADSADSIGSGAPGDSTAILKALLDSDTTEMTLLTLVDPQAVAEGIAAGIGNEASLIVGGKMDNICNEPVRINGRVKTIFDGKFTMQGPSYTGLDVDMGRTVVLKSDGIHLVITEKRTWTLDPSFYRAVGLEPRLAKIVVTKSNIGFRACYAPIAGQMIWVDGPGLSSPNLASLLFERVRRPLFPLDDT